MTERDGLRQKCLDAMQFAYARAAILSNTMEIMTRILDSLHGIVRLVPIEATEEMINSLDERWFGSQSEQTDFAEMFDIASAVGDITKPRLPRL
jgi:hypothetical protein